MGGPEYPGTFPEYPGCYTGSGLHEVRELPLDPSSSVMGTRSCMMSSRQAWERIV